jgi:Tfp pilus assembly protein PilN
MRPVNLLPAGVRNRGGGAPKNSSYILLGVLGLMVVAVLMYVLAANKVTSGQGELAKAQAETAAAQQRAQSFASYGNFAAIKQQRLATVAMLAQQRFDWERLARETAHVVPSNVSLLGFEAALSGGAQPAGAEQQATPQPTLRLNGCAPNHPAVADTLVRLRRLHRVEDVTLGESMRGESGDAAAGGSGSCDKKQSHAFTVTVKFSAEEAKGGPVKVPARLGGGA